MKINPRNTWRLVEQRLATETDPRLRRNLQTILAHMKAEAALDLDALMATVAQDAHYHAYSSGAPRMNPRGKAAIRQFYVDFAASGAYRLELDVDRLIVDVHCVLTEGVMRMAYPGQTLIAMGHQVDDPQAFYLFETRMAVVWPMNEQGLILGEDSYVGTDGFAGIERRKLRPEDIGTPEAA
ncbi:MAG TPA: nuclear transport factor 2 family protein [Candidatus Binataceae bacterium]|nr:nuclear transport factor 2 family protein [Candidatus Binataceae bacterium]